MEQTNMTRAAIYARYSSLEQTGGESIEFQLERCRDYIEAEGLNLPDENVFVDEAKSGTTTLHRDEFNRMIALARQGRPPFDVLVVYSTSRFGRNMDEAAFNKAFLRRQGIEVKFASQPMPEGDGIMGHVGKLMEKVFEWTDELQSIQTGEYAFEGQRQVTQKGYHGGGRAPYGYRRVKVKDPEGKTGKDGNVVEYVTFKVDEEQAPVVYRIFEAYANGSAYKAIAHRLNEDLLPSPAGRTWDISGVRHILLNETYLGRRIWNRVRRNKKVRRGTKKAKPREEWIVTEDAHEPIVTQELWDAVQERRGQLKVYLKDGKGNYGTARSPFMLTGLLKCAECGGNYTITGIKRKSGKTCYYRCSYHINRGNAVCTNNRHVRQDVAEQVVLEALSERLLTPQIIYSILDEIKECQKDKEGDESSRPTEAQAELRRMDREAHNLLAAIKAGGPMAKLVSELKACENRQEALEAELRQLESSSAPGLVDISKKEVEEGLKDLKHTLSHATPQELKSLLQEHIHEIQIPKKGEALLKANPEGLLSALRCFYMVTPRGVETVANTFTEVYVLESGQFRLLGPAEARGVG